MNFYPFHIGDYAAHTRHLSLIEDLAYRRLIDAYYLAEKPFSGDIKAIAKEVGMADHFEEIEYVLNKYFQFWVEDCTWRNKRADEEIEKYHAKADSARNANRIKLEKKSVLKPVLKSEADQIVTKNQEPITNNHIKTTAPIGFDLFWDAYDKKVGKPNSLKAWKKINFEKYSLQEILNAAKADKAAKPDNKYRKDPERWLKGQHWLDEMIVVQVTKPKELPLVTEKQIEEAYRIECGGDPTQARFNSYFEMKKFILDQRDKRART